MNQVVIISASRETESNFYTVSALGKSFTETFKEQQFTTKIFFNNTRGLSECYNEAIESQGDADDILVFMHDDVYITDFFWIHHLTMGLEKFKLAGVAGNKKRALNQPSWHFILSDKPPGLQWDDQANLSGIVGHGDNFPCFISNYGPSLEACKLVDGVFLAARRKTFLDNNIRFDPRFKFHFYDMDICRQFEEKGLAIGTIPISIIHLSGGNFGTPVWREAYFTYLNKWKS